MFWIFFLLFLCILSFSMGWTTLGLMILGFFVIVGILAIVGNNEAKKKQEEAKIRRQEKVAQKQAEIEAKTPIYNSAKNELIEKYGQPDKTIILEDLNFEKEIIAFGSTNRIWLLGKDLPMSDILSCTFNDNQRIVKGAVS